MNHSTSIIGKNLDLSGSVWEQIKSKTCIDNHHDAGYVSLAAIETVQTRHLQSGKESMPGGNH